LAGRGNPPESHYWQVGCALPTQRSSRWIGCPAASCCSPGTRHAKERLWI